MKVFLIATFALFMFNNEPEEHVFYPTKVDCVDEKVYALRAGTDIAKGDLIIVPIINQCSCIRKIQGLD